MFVYTKMVSWNFNRVMKMAFTPSPCGGPEIPASDAVLSN